VPRPVADPARLKADLRVLCEDIGCRLAGSPNEARAAEYLAAQYRAIGLDTEIQPFPCVCWECHEASLQVKRGSRWRDIPLQPNTQSPSTPGAIEGELVYLETADPMDMAGVDLTGKIGLLFGSAYASLERMDRICNSGLAALLYVDERFPTREKVASGLIAGWIDRLTLPTATIPYLDAWDLVRDGVRQVRLNLRMRNFMSHSQNVVATLPGRRKLPPVVIGGHHDSVATNAGAEDDGSGVVITLELARLLRDSKPLRPIRFVSFGWEENLSEGSRHYVIHPANQAERTGLMFNIDSVGGWMGRDEVWVTGDARLRGFVAGHLKQQRFVGQIMPTVTPFSDHYPFNLVGVPTVWFYRPNCPGGRWYHHTSGDTMDKLDMRRLARTADLVGSMVAEVASSAELPFPRDIPAKQRKEIEQYRQDLFDPICDWRTPGLMRPEGKRREDIEEEADGSGH
jgi:aminopeptidase YwaD